MNMMPPSNPRPYDEDNGTSAGKSMAQRFARIVPMTLLAVGTMNHGDGLADTTMRMSFAEQTSVGYPTPIMGEQPQTQEHRAADVVNTLRKDTGLTWDQIAKLLSTTRRSVHNWASGEPISSSNHERLCRIAATVKQIGRGSAAANRALLLSSVEDGALLIDLLSRGDYGAAVEAAKRYQGQTSGMSKKREMSNWGLVAQMDAKHEPVLDQRVAGRVVRPATRKRA